VKVDPADVVRAEVDPAKADRADAERPAPGLSVVGARRSAPGTG
jgi:hypothetical protein